MFSVLLYTYFQTYGDITNRSDQNLKVRGRKIGKVWWGVCRVLRAAFHSGKKSRSSMKKSAWTLVESNWVIIHGFWVRVKNGLINNFTKRLVSLYILYNWFILGALHSLNSEQNKKLQSQRELLRRKQGWYHSFLKIYCRVQIGRIILIVYTMNLHSDSLSKFQELWYICFKL